MPAADMAKLPEVLARLLQPDEYHYVPYANSDGDTRFLLVVMTRRQRELLEAFGHCAAVDSTHLLNQYGFPTFQIVVSDDRQVSRSAALIITLNETETTLREAFGVALSLARGAWTPGYVLVDQAPAQATALHSLFEAAPGSDRVVFFCLFHVLRSIQLNLRKHPIDRAEAAFKCMRSALMTSSKADALTSYNAALLSAAGLPSMISVRSRSCTPCVRSARAPPGSLT